MFNPCTSFIYYVLILPHPAQLSKRIRITSVTMPSVYAHAWLRYQRSARESLNLTLLSEQVRQLRLPME